MSRPIVFKTRIDTRLLVVALTLIAIVVVIIDVLVARGSVLGWALVVVLTAGGVVLPLWILLQTRYLLGEEQLGVVCGPFRWSVPIADISEVTEVNSRAPNPALSRRRLRLDYGQGRSLMISPDHRDVFLRSLEMRRETGGTPA